MSWIATPHTSFKWNLPFPSAVGYCPHAADLLIKNKTAKGYPARSAKLLSITAYLLTPAKPCHNLPWTQWQVLLHPFAKHWELMFARAPRVASISWWTKNRFSHASIALTCSKGSTEPDQPMGLEDTTIRHGDHLRWSNHFLRHFLPNYIVRRQGWEIRELSNWNQLCVRKWLTCSCYYLAAYVCIFLCESWYRQPTGTDSQLLAISRVPYYRFAFFVGESLRLTCIQI